jgi:hypothetical protein
VAPVVVRLSGAGSQQDRLVLDLVNHPEVAATVPAAAKILAVFLAHHHLVIEQRMSAHDEAGARQVVNAAGLGAKEFRAFLKRAREILP